MWVSELPTNIMLTIKRMSSFFHFKLAISLCLYLSGMFRVADLQAVQPCASYRQRHRPKRTLAVPHQNLKDE